MRGMGKIMQRVIGWTAAGCILLLAIGCRPSGQAPAMKPSWTNYELNTSVFALAFEGNSVWVGTDKGLIRYDLTLDQVVARFNSQNGLVSDIVTAIEID